MMRYLGTRILSMIPVGLAITLVVFLILRLAPGDPVLLLAGPRPTPELIERIERKWGFDRPLHEQFFRYVSHLIRGDLGYSVMQRRPVTELIALSLPVTLELGLAGIGLAIAIGIPAGVVSAVRSGSWVDQLAMFASIAGISIPGFWLGLMLIYAFAVRLKWLPSSGYGTLQHLVLPAVALGTSSAALLSRVMRSSMLDVIRRDYIRTARAKGLAERVVIYKHALKNAMLPVVTILGLNLGYMLAGSVVLENVFARPGMGRLLINGILQRDYPVVQGMLLMLALSVMLANLLADITYVFLDPKIRFD